MEDNYKKEQCRNLRFFPAHSGGGILSSIAFIASSVSVIQIILAESLLTGPAWAEKIFSVSLITFPVIGLFTGIVILYFSRKTQIPSFVLRRGWIAIIINISILLLLLLFSVKTM